MDNTLHRSSGKIVVFTTQAVPFAGGETLGTDGFRNRSFAADKIRHIFLLLTQTWGSLMGGMSVPNRNCSKFASH